MSIGIDIHTVGHHLQKMAMSAAADKKDAYARSAFNRYYYSALLNTREMLRSKGLIKSKLKHANYPNFLKTTVIKALNHKSRMARRYGDHDLEKRIEIAKQAVRGLAKIMNDAYAVRMVADYHTDVPVKFSDSSRFSLQSINITDAHQWENGTRVLCKSVEKVWEEISG